MEIRKINPVLGKLFLPFNETGGRNGFPQIFTDFSADFRRRRSA
jgi:hypothetical protein